MSENRLPDNLDYMQQVARNACGSIESLGKIKDKHIQQAIAMSLIKTFLLETPPSGEVVYPDSILAFASAWTMSCASLCARSFQSYCFATSLPSSAS
jgi:hypothetical protein